jgi:pentose-5-phosphate-3-epimerase
MINHAIRFIGADDGTTMEELLSGYLNLQQEATNEKTSCDRLKELAALSTDLARRVAANLSSPTQLLRTLANSRDATTRSYVAANPNTPTEVLLHLGGEFPEQLLNNPIFSLLWLENPNLVDEMPFTTLVNLLKQELVPVFVLEQAAIRCDRKVQLAVTMNAQTPRTVLEKLVQGDDTQVAEAAQLHVNWAGELPQAWDEDAHKAIQTAVLHPKNQKYIEELAKLGLIPEFIVDRLPRNGYGDKFLEAVARGVNNLPHLLEQLARDQKWEFRAAVATNPNTPVSLLDLLAGDEDLIVRKNVATNPNTPVTLLNLLAGDTYSMVRREVAKNSNTPRNLLEQLALDQHDLVRQAVVQNSNRFNNFLEPLVLAEDVVVGKNIAKRPNTPLSVLEQSQNPSTPESLLELLAKDKTAEVRCGVVHNPNTSERRLKQLLSDREWKVRLVAMEAYLAQNPDALPVMLGHQLRKKSEGYEMSDYSPSSFIRLLFLFHPQIPSQALAENSRSLAWLERYAIAQHPNTPLDTLQTLALDANRVVRAAAKAHLQTCR